MKKKKGKSGKREEGRPIRKEDGVREINFWIDNRCVGVMKINCTKKSFVIFV